MAGDACRRKHEARVVIQCFFYFLKILQALGLETVKKETLPYRLPIVIIHQKIAAHPGHRVRTIHVDSTNVAVGC